MDRRIAFPFLTLSQCRCQALNPGPCRWTAVEAGRRRMTSLQTGIRRVRPGSDARVRIDPPVAEKDLGIAVRRASLGMRSIVSARVPDASRD